MSDEGEQRAKDALVKLVADVIAQHPCDRDYDHHEAKDCPQAKAVLENISRARPLRLIIEQAPRHPSLAALQDPSLPVSQEPATNPDRECGNCGHPYPGEHVIEADGTECPAHTSRQSPSVIHDGFIAQCDLCAVVAARGARNRQGGRVDERRAGTAHVVRVRLGHAALHQDPRVGDEHWLAGWSALGRRIR